MPQSDLINKKLDELIALAKVEGDNNTLIVLLGLRGAQCSNVDGLFAAAVQKIIMEVMLPMAERDRDETLGRMN